MLVKILYLPDMKTVKTEGEIAAGGTLLLEKLPFREGERVLVTIALPATFSTMRAYAEKMAGESAQLVSETDEHTTERLLRETEW
jgi:hypothetical protein